MTTSEYKLRRIGLDDYDRGYLNLLQSFANYYPKISKTEFQEYIFKHPTTHIIVVEHIPSRTIVGAGTVFCIEKIHNNVNSMGFIQDIIVEEKHRGKGLGKQIVDNLYEIAKENRCYKVILNCNKDVETFYTNLGFIKKGVEFDKR